MREVTSTSKDTAGFSRQPSRVEPSARSPRGISAVRWTPAASFVLVFAATAAQAKSSEPAAKAPDQDIVVVGRNAPSPPTVSATRTEGPILTTPQAISIVDEALTEALNVRTLAEALNYTSGVRSQALGSDTRIEYVQLRGFQQQSLVKDGLVLNSASAFLSWTTPIEGVERLEVLKGPSSTLYGGGSAGGLVNIVSKGTMRATLARSEAGLDENGTAYTSFDLGHPISEAAALRINALVRRGDTQVRLAEDNRAFGSIAIDWTPRDDTSLTVRGSHTRDRSNRPTGFLPYAGFVMPLGDGRRIPIDLYVSDPAVDRYDRDQSELGYDLQIATTSWVRIVSRARAARLSLTYAGLYGLFSGNPVLADGRWYLKRGNSRQEGWLESIAADNHIVGSVRAWGIAHEIVAGVDVNASRTASRQLAGPAPRLDIFDPHYGGALPPFGTDSASGQKVYQMGLYVQDRITSGPLTALLAIRQDQLALTSRGPENKEVRASWARTSYRFGLSYLTSAGIAPFVSFATSFAPVIGVEAATGTHYRPDTGESWEGGVKFDLAMAGLTATASLFSIERTGILVSNPLPGFPMNQSQLGGVISRGGEVEVTAHPLPGLLIQGSLTAFDIKTSAGVGASVGRTPTQIPESVASALLDYSLPAASHLSGLGVGLGVRHVSRSYADLDNRLVVPGVTVLDASVRYDVGRLRLALHVSNLLDTAFAAACTSPGTCYAGSLRRATISIAYRLPSSN